MKEVYYKGLAFVLCFCLGMINGISQGEVYYIDEANVSITGASTLHDWKVEAPDVKDLPKELSIDMVSGGVIKDFAFKVSVSSMDGGRGAAMNKKILKALKSDVHPFVSYKQSAAAPYTVVDDTSLLLTPSGSIAIGGVSKDIDIEVQGKLTEKILVLRADYPMKLSSFDIDPPSAMFGQIQTKDDIVVHLEFIYKSN